jgi:hypothetical protein
MIHTRLAQPSERGVDGRGVHVPAATRPRHGAEAFFGAVAMSRQIPSQAAGKETAEGEPGDRARSGASRIAALLKRCARLISAEWLMLRWRGASGEPIIATHGSVEIRQTAAAWTAQTCVKGEADQARETALRRLARYTNGDNRDALSLRVELPVIQQQLDPRWWRVGVRLSDVEIGCAAPAPLAPKVRIVPPEPEILAVVRMDGRPSRDLVSFGDAIILDAISSTEWVAIGAASIRLHTPGLLRRLIGGFEVAVPVSVRKGDGTTGVC